MNLLRANVDRSPLQLSFFFPLSSNQEIASDEEQERPRNDMLIDRQIRIYFFCPSVDSAFEVFQFFEASAG